MPYLEDIQSLLAWNSILIPPESVPGFSTATIAVDNHVPIIPFPQSAAKYVHSKKRKLLACHDMMGGYSEEDSDPQGNPKLSQVFTIHTLSAVDVFIYFSHHRASIPPAQWTNLVHAHGCQMFGTLLFEWDQAQSELAYFMYGEQALLIKWPTPIFEGKKYLGVDDSQLELPPLSYEACDRLVHIAIYYKLDGWFFNVETRLPGGSKQAKHLARLVGYLDEKLKAVNPLYQVLWYDSVTDQGLLRWQNKLNGHNKMYFDECSGIFLNYFWDFDDPLESAQLAGDRAHQVYTGVDCWDRGTWGGGKFNCGIAMEVIAAANTSAALFAPGWVYEELPRQEMLDNERKLWDPIVATFPHRRPLMATNENNEEFCTYFNTAAGEFFIHHGLLLLYSSWSNHSLQSQIPVLSEQAILDTTAAFYGSSSLKVSHGELVVDLNNIHLYEDSVIWVVFTMLHDQPCTLRATASTKDAHGASYKESVVWTREDCYSIPNTIWKLGCIPQSTKSMQAHLESITIQVDGVVNIGQVAVHRTSQLQHEDDPKCAVWKMSNGHIAVDRKDTFSDLLQRVPCAIYVEETCVDVMLQPRYILPVDVDPAVVRLKYLHFYQPYYDTIEAETMPSNSAPVKDNVGEFAYQS